VEGTTFMGLNLKMKKLILGFWETKKLKYLAKRIEFPNNFLF